jgi:hypothetical protein
MLSYVDVPLRGQPDRRPPTLDALALLSADALEAVFRDAGPVGLRSLDGHPRGRVLAIPGRDAGRVAGALRAAHASSLWPWEGKSFESTRGATEGAGINRVRFPVRTGLFPFRTYMTKSVIDGRPCVAIDYDVAHGPRFARAVYDEVREVCDGLFLGRGMRRGPRGPRLVLWFALDARIQDAPVAFRKPS